MKKTVYVLIVDERSQYLPSYRIAVETWKLFGFIPVWQRQFLLDC